MLALTHTVPTSIARCEVSYVARSVIDHALAVLQHDAYSSVLEECGTRVRKLDVSPDLPDAAFVEDAAIVLDEFAIATSMGVASRRAEVANLRPVLAEYRRVETVELPATLEGGDVLRIGRRLYVGLSERTNRAGVEALARIAGPLDYRVVPVRMSGCLHLKTACTALDEDVLLAHPAWIDSSVFAPMEVLPVPDSEPWGANALRIGRTVCLSAAYARTAELVSSRGYEVRTIDISELEKAEAGLTCLSVMIGGV